MEITEGIKNLSGKKTGAISWCPWRIRSVRRLERLEKDKYGVYV